MRVAGDATVDADFAAPAQQAQKHCQQLFYSFQNIPTSIESTSIDAGHINGESWTRRTQYDAQQTTQQARARTGTAQEHTSSPCTLP